MKMLKALKEDGIIYTSLSMVTLKEKEMAAISQISRKRHLKSLLVK